MKITVERAPLYSAHGATRVVDVPEDQWEAAISHLQRLDLIYYFGQNDIQPRKSPSVSVGDVAVMPNGQRFVCRNIGWELQDCDHNECS